MSYNLFLGCVIPARIPFVEASSRKILEKLGISISDMKGCSCCPDPTGLPAIDLNSWLTIGARNLSLADNGNGILSLCSGCTETLKTVNHILFNDNSKRDNVNQVLSKIGRQITNSIDVKHFAQVIYEKLDILEKNVVKPLEGFKVACHYGCHYLRPSHIIDWDDPFDPITLDEIVKTLGAESIDYKNKMECCGNPVEKADEDLSRQMIEMKYENISNANANCVVVVCPACYMQFDFKQRNVNQVYNKDYYLPTFYLSELIALALGFNPKEIGLNFHSTKVNSFFDKIKFNGE
ncbi:MAG: CoB--CoM heterodisulfide reductase iron-sulfur subunit B family protein [Candidatus Helarchaeota archaeon]